MLGPKIYVTHFFHFIDWRADGSQCKQKGTFSVVVEEDAFDSYIRNMSEEQEAQLHISVYA